MERRGIRIKEKDEAAGWSKLTDNQAKACLSVFLFNCSFSEHMSKSITDSAFLYEKTIALFVYNTH
jgi:hypothetical protein